MKCVICKSGEMKNGRVTVTLEKKETVIVIKNVPAQVCENCGEYTLSDKVVAKVLKLAERAITHNAEVEILQYAA